MALQAPQDGPVDALGEMADQEDVAGHAQADAEADALLQELADSQAEVKRMLLSQRDTAVELGGLKSKMEMELRDLQEEAWRLQTFGELEALKRQLTSLEALEADLDAAEAVLDASADVDRLQQRAEKLRITLDTVPGEEEAPQGVVDAPASEEAAQEQAESEEGEEDEEEGGDREYDPAEIEALQAKLDAELESMFAALQAVKSEAASVSARKVALEKELRDLLAGQGELEGEEGDVLPENVAEAEGKAQPTAPASAVEAVPTDSQSGLVA